MSDIDTVWNVDHGDWVMAGADLQSGDDLTTAIILSLFSDAAAGPDDVIPDAAPGQPPDPRGWWGDIGETVVLGSKLWLRRNAKATRALPGVIQNDIQAALQWLIADGVVASVTVVAQYVGPGQIGAWVTVARADGTRLALAFPSVWQGVS